ncbi:ABC-type multidrug transport system permease subunit [Neorhizobium huautlense]|uniref:ABC-type multidrug transport system permease subunit n=1 Tax=Neorhizobium huautlense TaxID=67774 RepID=A0ABT9PNB6_9HYPH|nr:hypothetical protein [Neorhizobium huautlense]MDP9835951.1 ABC-type multidrug transport system permease subunit [Neorhizobium huautlense]
MFSLGGSRQFSMPWKITAAFWVVIVILMLSGFAAQQMQWYGLSSRLFAYMALCAVGYAISWLCLVYVNARHIRKQLTGRGHEDDP